MPAYELWELRSGNLIGSFPSTEAALSVIASTVRLYGPSSVDSVVMTYETGEDSTDIAEGRALAEWAMSLPSDPAERTA